MARDLADQLQLLEFEGEIYTFLGEYFNKIGNFEKVSQYLTSAIQCYKKAKNNEKVIFVSAKFAEIKGEQEFFRFLSNFHSFSSKPTTISMLSSTRFCAVINPSKVTIEIMRSSSYGTIENIRSPTGIMISIASTRRIKILMFSLKNTMIPMKLSKFNKETLTTCVAIIVLT
jgi:hypothetical protein